ncbi:MAG: cell wall-binding repeat-containing protein [Motilibacteraceae bacterium]
MLRLSAGRTGLRTLALTATVAALSTVAVGTAAATPTTDCRTTATGSLCRVFGQDRYETAIAASQDVWAAADDTTAPADSVAKAVVLAGGTAFADAVSGVPLAYAEHGPLLLTPAAALRTDVADEIARILPPKATVYLLGGTGSLSDDVEKAVTAAGFTPKRLAGGDRYETSVKVAQELGALSYVTLASGRTFPDALTAGNAMAFEDSTDPAAPTHGAVLLTQGTKVPDVVSTFLAAHPDTKLLAAGGEAATAAQNAKLSTQADFVGQDRYETAALIADAFYGADTIADGPTTAGLASGENFPDALAGGVHAAVYGAPLLLTPAAALDATTADFLHHYGPSLVRVTVYGGTGSVSADTAAAARAAID